MPVLYRILVDVVVVVHFALLGYLVLGGFLALRWRRMLWPHLAFVVWGVVTSVFPVACPLTAMEAGLRSAAGMPAIESDFVTAYLEGVLYPDHHVNRARAVALLVILISWAWVALRAWLVRRAVRLMPPPAVEMLPSANEQTRPIPVIASGRRPS